MGFAGRPERAGELRDAVHLLRPRDLPGPAGEIYQRCRRVVEWPVSLKALHRALPEFEPDTIANWLDGSSVGQGARAATVLEAILTDVPHAEVSALILADAALAQTLGWGHLVPLLSLGLKRANLRKQGEELRLACHRAVIPSASEAVRLSLDLTRRVARLNAVAPKLWAKGPGRRSRYS